MPGKNRVKIQPTPKNIRHNKKRQHMQQNNAHNKPLMDTLSFLIR